MSNRIVTVLCVGISLTFVILILRPVADPGNNEYFSAERHYAHQLIYALEAYKADYGDYPHGTNAEIMRILRGTNPHKVAYFDASEKSFNENGELVDHWRTPYQIEPDASPRPRVSSAGKNKVFDGDAKGSDDICSWH